jgi:hypothetical protein
MTKLKLALAVGVVLIAAGAYAHSREETKKQAPILELGHPRPRPLVPAMQLCFDCARGDCQMTTMTVRGGVLAGWVAALIAVSGAGARAQSLDVEKRWYGWQTLLVDASASATGLLVYGGRDSDLTRGLVTTGVIYGFGGPIVHFAHRNPGRAAGSFALRLVLPVLGAIVGYSASSCSHLNCGDQSGTGLLVGMVTASVVDAAALSWAEVSPAPPPPVALQGGEAQLVVDARHRTLGFGGTF